MRVVLLAVTLLALPSMAGCLEDTFGVCSSETPKGYVTDDACLHWVIEVDHVSGQAPSTQALDALESAMQALVRKDSVDIIMSEANLAGGNTWTDAELRALEKETRDYETGGNTIVTHVLYVDGAYAPNENVLGVTFGHSFVVMFDERIEDLTSDILVKTTAFEMERAVLIHEFGHVIGLVNRGIPMHNDHEADTCDTGSGSRADSKHSDNPDSVMYCAVERAGALEIFGDSAPPYRFDADDKKDIACYGGKGTC